MGATRINIIPICLMIAIGLFSFFLFIHQSLRLDEAQTIWQTYRSPLGILHVVGKDVHVPLYHLAVYFWQIVFGHGIATARAFSVVMFMISVPLLIMLGDEVYASRRSSVFAAALFAFSPFMNWYGNDIRMYSMLVAVTILQQYLFIRIRKGAGSGAWSAYGLLSVVGMYTHYFFFLVLISQGLFYSLYRAHFPPGSFKRFAQVAGVVLLAFAPWIIYVFYLGEVGNSQPLLSRPGIIEIFNTFSYFLFGEQGDTINSLVVALWPLIMLGWFFSLQKTKTINTDTAYLLFSVVFPVGFFFAASLMIRPIYLERYLIFTLPAFFLLVGAMIMSYAPPLRRIAGVSLSAAMIAVLFIGAYDFNSPVRENYAGAGSYLTLNAQARDVVIVSAPFTIYPVAYYYQGTAAIQTLPIWDRFAPGPIPAYDPAKIASEVRQVAGAHERAWLLLSYDQGYEKNIRDYFDTHYQRLETHTLSPGLTLSLYRLRYDTVAKI